VQFHLTKFEKFNGGRIGVYDSGALVDFRAVFEAGGWRVIIDSIKEIEDKLKFLKSQGSYAITHVGRLEQLNG
jgi:hypothetical protein